MSAFGMKPLLLCLFLSFCSCATRLYNPRTGLPLASLQGRYATVHYSGGGVTFDATQMSHATETNAVFNGATKVTTALGAAGVIGTALP